ncbi:hypothetical protein [Chryseobacterium sp. 3008163]|uniref:hypothetical protein n=1 Tax=Chryseobacterium sp. 3008163 TaxID=2478663 RepID=UPI001013C643|nr:hypothetical protein [Chryseobacterium sp. 3008163]
MMKKNKNSIFKNMRPQGTMWKLGFFFSFLLILTSNSVFAHSETTASESVVDFSTVSVAQTPETVIHVAEGTTIYGSDLTSKTPATSSSSKLRKQKKRAGKGKAIELTKKNVQLENKSKKPETKILVLNHPSDNSFNVSKHTTSVGTITVNNTLKSIVHDTFFDFKIIPLSFYNNSLFKYSIPFIKEITDRYSFTRPPPFT